jgi:hypothetical protein
MDGRERRFHILDTSPGGVGMLIEEERADVLEDLRIGRILEAEYETGEAVLPMRFVIRHVTPIERGPFKGHYQVGLSMGGDQASFSQ